MQGVVEDALRTLAREPVRSTLAGRTDRGVHAEHQVLHADVPVGLAADLHRVCGALRHLCGADIAVWDVAVAAEGFDARFSAVQRRYRYQLSDDEVVPPLRRRQVWHVGPPALDVTAMRDGATHLRGEHDFSAFCRRAGDQHLVRRVDLLEVERGGSEVHLHVAGPAFCHQMVRSVVAALVRVGRGQRSADWVCETLEGRDRQPVGAIAPPHGLILAAVSY